MKINLNLIEILGKTTTKIEVKDTFMKLMFNTQEFYELHNDLLFLLKRMEIEIG